LNQEQSHASTQKFEPELRIVLPLLDRQRATDDSGVSASNLNSMIRHISQNEVWLCIQLPRRIVDRPG
jgi:hypothetical protein